jgi:hypothetical protein
MDTVGQIMAYESGEMEETEMVAFFQFRRWWNYSLRKRKVK